MTHSVCIAIDAMSGDHGAEICVPAALDQLKTEPDLKLILVGQESVPCFLRLPSPPPFGVRVYMQAHQFASNAVDVLIKLSTYLTGERVEHNGADRPDDASRLRTKSLQIEHDVAHTTKPQSSANTSV